MGRVARRRRLALISHRIRSRRIFFCDPARQSNVHRDTAHSCQKPCDACKNHERAVRRVAREPSREWAVPRAFAVWLGIPSQTPVLITICHPIAEVRWWYMFGDFDLA